MTADTEVVALTALGLAVLLLWRKARRLELDGDAESLRTDALEKRVVVLSKRADLLTRAIRRQRDRDPERTVEMTAEELEKAKRARASRP